MPIGSTVVYNAGDLILSTVSSSGNTFQENKIAAATSSIILFNQNGLISSQSLNSTTVGTSSFTSGSTSIITNLTASNITSSGYGIFKNLEVGDRNITGSVLEVSSNTGSTSLIRASGTNGILFNVVDDLSDSLMSVNDASGLPIFEVFADDRIVAGQYGYNDFVIRNNKIGIGTNNPSNTLDVIGNISASSITASLLGTSSWAINALTASFVPANTPNTVTNIAGTENEILVNGVTSAVTGAVTISLPDQIIVTSVSASSFTSSINNSVGFFGTSSWAQSSSVALSAITASFLPIATYNITSSWATNALTASSLVTANNYSISNLTANDITINELNPLIIGNTNNLHNIYLEKPLVAGTGFQRMHFGTRWFWDYSQNVWTSSVQPNSSNPDWVAIDSGQTFLSFKMGNITGSTTSLTTSSYNSYECFRISTQGATLTISGSDSEFRIVTNDTVNDPKLTFYSSSTAMWAMGVDDSDDNKFKINQGSLLSTSNILTINTSSNVGIGITNPINKLDVAGNISASNITASLFGTASWAQSSSFSRTASFIGSGTNNFVPKWSNNSLTSTSNIYDSGSKIGIGTSTNLTHFVNIFNTSGSDQPTGSMQIQVNNGTVPYEFIKLIHSSNGGSAGPIISGYVNDGGSCDGGETLLRLSGYGSNELQNFYNGAYISLEADGTFTTGSSGNGSAPSRIVFCTSPSGSVTPVESVRISSTGWVGIGTTGGVSNLHVYTGSTAATSNHQVEFASANLKRILFLTNAAGSSYNPIVANGDSGIIFLSSSNSSSQCFFIAPWDTTAGGISISGSGEVGIGTSDPRGTLHVVGNITASSVTASLFGTSSWANNSISASFVSNAFVQGGNSFGTTATLGTNDAQSLVLETNNTARMTINSAGNVGIGITPSTISRLSINATHDSSLGSSSISLNTVLENNGTGSSFNNVGFNNSYEITNGVNIFTGSSQFSQTQATLNNLYISLTGNTTGSYRALRNNVTVNSAITMSSVNSALINGYFLNQWNAYSGAANIPESYGILIQHTGNSTITGSISNFYSMYASGPSSFSSGAFSIGTTYGLYLTAHSLTNVVNRSYGIYQNGTSDINIFRGNTSFASTSIPSSSVYIGNNLAVGSGYANVTAPTNGIAIQGDALFGVSSSAGYTVQIGQNVAGDTTNYQLGIQRNGTTGTPGNYQTKAIELIDFAGDGPSTVDAEGVVYIYSGRIASSDVYADNASLLNVRNDTGGVLRVTGKQNVFVGYTTATTSSLSQSLFCNGRVGIGVTNPTQRLEVVGDVSASAIRTNDIHPGETLRIYATNHPLYCYDSSSGVILARITNPAPGIGNSSDFILRSGSTDVVDISSNGNSYFNGGNVGIGTTNPTYKLHVIGSFAATTKSFVIDHPTKQNKKLVYGALESPYHGIRLTGKGHIKNGLAEIELPEYICKLVRPESVNIQLTPIKCGKMIYVEDIYVSENKFTVGCEDISKEFDFFWDFTGIRTDVEELQTEI